jgi:hypothetical protein
MTTTPQEMFPDDPAAEELAAVYDDPTQVGEPTAKPTEASSWPGKDQGEPEPDFSSPAKPFEIGAELNEDVAAEEVAKVYAEPDDEDAEMARIFQQGGAQAPGAEEDWEIDWDPEMGLLEVGIHPQGRLANVEKSETSGFNDKPKVPAIIWYVTDVPTNKTVKKTVPMVGESGIQRLNVQFARIFGVEPEEKQVMVRGKLQTRFVLSPTALKKCVGMPCAFKVAHFGTPKRDSLEEILPPSAAAGLDLPSYPEDV